MASRRDVLKGLSVSAGLIAGTGTLFSFHSLAQSVSTNAGLSQKPFAPVSRWAGSLIEAAEL